MRLRIDLDRFEKLVANALDDLPPDLAEKMSNVEVVVEELPSESTVEELEVKGEWLLGLYQGVPLTKRDAGYFGVLPDRIVLYKRNIERASRDLEDLEKVVRKTVIHEVAHHFGIDDERLNELGWA